MDIRIEDCPNALECHINLEENGWEIFCARFECWVTDGVCQRCLIPEDLFEEYEAENAISDLY